MLDFVKYPSLSSNYLIVSRACGIPALDLDLNLVLGYELRREGRLRMLCSLEFSLASL